MQPGIEHHGRSELLQGSIDDPRTAPLDVGRPLALSNPSADCWTTKSSVLDAAKRQFGLRTFRMEYVAEPKGRMYLNGQGIKLRGANTMGALPTMRDAQGLEAT